MRVHRVIPQLHALSLSILTAAILLVVYPHASHAVNPGDASPEFSVPSNKGQSVSLSQFKGKLVYLDVWAAWCQTCKQSLTWMQEMQTKYGARGFQVVAINVDESREKAVAALRDAGVELLVGFDPEGTVPSTYNVESMPTSYLIDAGGKVLSVHRGFDEKDKHEIEKQIAIQIKNSH